MKTVLCRSAAAACLAASAIATTPVQAQQAAGALNETQLLGRQVFAQSCGICHLQPSMGVKTYGPPLDKSAANGSDDVMRAFILNGTDRMPAFRYYLKPAEIDAIIAYVRTLPASLAPAANAQK
jgi:mono/diheme cytochrome c family protein